MGSTSHRSRPSTGARSTRRSFRRRRRGSSPSGQTSRHDSRRRWSSSPASTTVRPPPRGGRGASRPATSRRGVASLEACNYCPRAVGRGGRVTRPRSVDIRAPASQTDRGSRPSFNQASASSRAPSAESRRGRGQRAGCRRRRGYRGHLGGHRGRQARPQRDAGRRASPGPLHHGHGRALLLRVAPLADIGRPRADAGAHPRFGRAPGRGPGGRLEGPAGDVRVGQLPARGEQPTSRAPVRRPGGRRAVVDARV